MWQTKYASAVPKNLGVGVNFGRAVKTISCLGVRSPCVWTSKSTKLGWMPATVLFIIL